AGWASPNRLAGLRFVPPLAVAFHHSPVSEGRSVRFEAAAGVPVRAAAAGRVSNIRSSSGNAIVVIDHGAGVTTSYVGFCGPAPAGGTRLARGEAFAEVCPGDDGPGLFTFSITGPEGPVQTLRYLRGPVAE
ncbi:MAG: M23 family metallopeptidase, partial [Pseudomonadota bacterium]